MNNLKSPLLSSPLPLPKNLLAQAEQLFQEYAYDEKQANADLFDWKDSFSLVGWAHYNWSQAEIIFSQLFEKTQAKNILQYSSTIQLPVFGFLLWKMYQIAKDKNQALIFLEEVYPSILQLHQHFYKTADSKEEGIWTVLYSERFPLYPITEWNQIIEKQHFLMTQDPLFNTILILSNECLINIGALLGEDVSEIIGWHEQGIHTINNKLWQADLSKYQAYDFANSIHVPTKTIASIIPLAAGIPDANKAFDLLDFLYFERGFLKESPILNWLLYQGLLLYETDEFLEIAEEIKAETVRSFKANGFQNLACAGVFIDWSLATCED